MASSRTSTSTPTISTFSVTKGGKVEETYECFRQWDLSASLDENLDQIQRENRIGARTGAWLKEMRKIFHARFGDIERHTPLIRLAKAHMPIDSWRPLLLWHLCFRELLLSDFLETWLFPRKQEGLLRVRGVDVRDYLTELRSRGMIDAPWTESTVSKMAGALPGYAADFGLLHGKTVKEITAFHLPDESLLYVLQSIAEETASADRFLNDVRWRRFLLSRSELEQELLRLHQLRKVRFDVAGSLVAVELPHQSVDEYVGRVVGL